MGIKIFHTGDIHIGMTFNSYPEGIRELLKSARIDVIERMVKQANREGCDLFVIAGDLFDKIKGIDKRTQAAVAGHLSKFEGACVVILPGNHDYHTEMVDLWSSFLSYTDDRLILLQEEKPYDLREYGLGAVIYPAGCHSKHSKENNLGWLKEMDMDKEVISIGVGHGALSGISPDLDNQYFNMALDELDRIPVNVWLMGHTHITYPEKDSLQNWKVYNPGTPEPDGLDCKHNGNAWIVNVDDSGEIDAKRVDTGKYSFMDVVFNINQLEDYSRIKNHFKEGTENTIARISLSGTLDEEAYRYRLKLKEELEERLLHLILEDSELKIRINSDKIHKEFTKGSFPEQLLLSLQEDEEALQLAYEIISEVRK
ncbi:metallophosphoesterase family protein [Gudongella sp. SC589]|uniref:metallophosphoesterase family protein n=1 Tax=Gudongella sp. SC589 TaxID=3385990 RepID=UPI003904B024